MCFHESYGMEKTEARARKRFLLSENGIREGESYYYELRRRENCEGKTFTPRPKAEGKESSTFIPHWTALAAYHHPVRESGTTP